MRMRSLTVALLVVLLGSGLSVALADAPAAAAPPPVVTQMVWLQLSGLT